MIYKIKNKFFKYFFIFNSVGKETHKFELAILIKNSLFFLIVIAETYYSKE